MTIGPFSVAIVAIICWAVVELINGPKGKKRNKKDDQDIAALQQEVLQCKERIATLEKIVTDEKYDLKREFENLKRDSAA
ncbi:hypothetical protein LJ739_01785 [Aestuariibacter halophilus]|uniref:Phage shock protein B n=1 Tax=Fluctibacter halophilus TaxID=226011 RepID=A0ABS8G520_9ALTE|nr:hypothetical protein [Aestuariibacter halophilus]MCC2614970.1 hypothetical protein [Aestuariibacter halophilus]